MITAILVNYCTAKQTISAVQSVVSQQAIQTPEIIVVDNSASDTEESLLREGLPDDTVCIVNSENRGFARACNQAFERSNGEFILLLNPDARLLPNALSKLQNSLKTLTDAGAAGPRVYWDDNCQFLMPHSTFPGIVDFYKETVSRLHPRLANYKSLDFRKKALKIWTATEPITVDALSGGHVLIRREAILKCGGLFDERFFMYWEDSDLMYRLKKAGYRLYIEPSARCLHYYEHHDKKDRIIAQGWSAYQQKHLTNKLSYQLVNWLNQRLRPVPSPMTESIAIKHNKLILPIPRKLEDHWLLELGVTPQMIPAIGCFGSGPAAEVSPILFKRLQKKNYFARLSRPIPHSNLVYYWQWQGYSPKFD